MASLVTLLLILLPAVCYGQTGVSRSDCYTRADCNYRGQCNPAGKCNCNAGYSGRFCEKNGITTVSSVGANNRCTLQCGQNARCVGTGVNQRCQCRPGYGGDDCSIPQCNIDCGQYGQCSAPDQCTCDDGWTGPTCQTQTRATLPRCQGGCGNGQCVADNVCQCQPGWNGATCNQRRIEVTGSLVGQRCLRDADCARNAYCEFYSKSCTGGGKCLCQTGYVEVDGECLLPKKYGDDCTDPDAYCVDNSVCVDGTCDCRSGFRQGALGYCDKATGNRRAGERCSSSGQCTYDLECYNGRCDCPAGKVATSSNYTCRVINFGEACRDNSDCGHIEQAECNSAVRLCACAPGYSSKSTLNEKGEQYMVCANNKVIKRGDSCPSTLNSICEDKYSCIQCPNANNASPRCLWSNRRGPEPLQSVYESNNQYIMSSAPDCFSKNFMRVVILAISFAIFIDKLLLVQ